MWAGRTSQVGHGGRLGCPSPVLAEQVDVREWSSVEVVVSGPAVQRVRCEIETAEEVVVPALAPQVVVDWAPIQRVRAFPAPEAIRSPRPAGQGAVVAAAQDVGALPA